MSNFANFGKQSSYYSKGRREYPDTVFLYLKTLLQDKDPILDIGCGTGISTRQLARHGFEDVQGVDKDSKMLEEAQENKEFKHILYFQAQASKMPFRMGQFKAITCFSSFHWFSDSLSINEMKRVLKKTGYIFIVQKQDRVPFGGYIKDRITEKTGLTFPEVQPPLDAKPILEKLSFEIIATKAFPGEDIYTLPDAVDYMRSTSFFPAIPEKDQQSVIDKIIKPALEEKMKWERIAREYDAITLVARKKN